nr:hypothetical protein [uncultured Duganella sp.]
MDLSESLRIEAMLAELPAAAVLPARVLPRFIRHRDAHTYLGVDRNKFNAEIRPTLIEIPLGKRSLAFDRLDLDAWADEYKRRNGRSSRKNRKLSCEQEQMVSKSPRMAKGPSTSSTKGKGFSPASAPSARRPQKPGSESDSSKSMSNADKLRRAISATRQKLT